MSQPTTDQRTGTDDGPVRRFLERLEPLTLAPVPADLTVAAVALAELAADLDYLGGWIRRLGETSGVIRIHAPERGPRLMLVHRLVGQMSAVHDHGTWVAVAAVTGLETHRHYRRPVRPSDPPALAEAVRLEPTGVVTMSPPEDVHDHGHLLGAGTPAYVLIATGDDQRRYERSEWDLASGRHRVLKPADIGRWTADEPWP